jgi:hypothetical protein
MLTPEIIVACKTNLAEHQFMSKYAQDGLAEVARSGADIFMLYPDGKFRPRPRGDNPENFSPICIYRIPQDWKALR